jgi:ankyrin repeat protein
MAWGAVESGNVRLLTELLAEGASVEKVGGFGVLSTPLQLAEQRRDRRLMRVLLEHNANPEVVNSKGQTILQVATIEGRLNVIELLLENRANVNARSNDTKSAIHYATHGLGERVALVEVLIRHGANVNDLDRYGRSPLHYAVEHNDESVVNLLLDNHTNLSQKDRNGLTAADTARHMQHIALADRLDRITGMFCYGKY